MYLPDGFRYRPIWRRHPYLGTRKGVTFGWLDTDHPFTIGHCPPRLLLALEETARDPICQMRGFHRCPWCASGEPYAHPVYQTATGEVIHVGSATLALTDHQSVRWLAPTLVLHYITSHSYAPPERLLCQYRD